MENGCAVRQPDLPGLAVITRAARKYGFHGTLKPPFRLSAGRTVEHLKAALSELAAGLSPASCETLELSVIGRFLALTPRGDMADLQRVAAACVRDLDAFRAPADTRELDRRRKAGLTARQEALLMQWGYPYVMEEFRFHMTLSGWLPKEDIPVWFDKARSHLPDVPAPFVMDQVALCGEREDGRFELIHRYTLAG